MYFTTVTTNRMLVDPAMPVEILALPMGIQQDLEAAGVNTLGGLCDLEGEPSKSKRIVGLVLWIRAALDYLSKSNLKEMAEHELMRVLLRRPWVDVLKLSPTTSMWIERSVGRKSTLKDVVELVAVIDEGTTHGPLPKERLAELGVRIANGQYRALRSCGPLWKPNAVLI